MSKIFGVSVDYLLGNEDASRGAVRIPVLGSIQAGIPLEAIEDIVDWEEIPQSYLAGGKEYMALQVKGDSMCPVFLEGDTVIVRVTPVCRSGDVCVVFVNGNEATLKKVRLNSRDNSLTIEPINTNYLPRTFTAEEIENLPVTIGGVVVELRRKKW